MPRFTRIQSIAAPMPTNHVDTDVIFPGRFLSTIQRTGLSPYLFHGLRYDEGGLERPEFILNQDPYRKAGILITGENFGCGSSREHAPWALLDFGIRCIISTSFADIFSGNCSKNGILCITLDSSTVSMLMEDADKGKELCVDLENQFITRASGESIDFSIAPDARQKLLSGRDEIDRTLTVQEDIGAFEARRANAFPWL